MDAQEAAWWYLKQLLNILAGGFFVIVGIVWRAWWAIPIGIFFIAWSGMRFRRGPSR